jgi:hypothetical protein
MLPSCEVKNAMLVKKTMSKLLSNDKRLLYRQTRFTNAVEKLPNSHGDRLINNRDVLGKKKRWKILFIRLRLMNKIYTTGCD